MQASKTETAETSFFVESCVEDRPVKSELQFGCMRYKIFLFHHHHVEISPELAEVQRKAARLVLPLRSDIVCCQVDFRLELGAKSRPRCDAG
jgi:hypothetical protein